jgi:DNA invertase Pin-like site-specific DNA recombinase
MAKQSIKRFVALARVSSREQEREGFSLDVQEESLQQYANRHNGEIVRMFRIAETASKRDERKTFKALLEFAKSHARTLDGLLFYKVDRAARNLFDYVELERLESEYDLQFISVSQPTENTPAGRMQRRVLASMASFYTEQQSIDVKDGLSKRVQNGLFVGKAPFGYRNVRIDGRSMVEIDPESAAKVKRIFDLYAYHCHTLDSLLQTINAEGMSYTRSRPKFYRCFLHNILTDRAYIGEVHHKGQWYPGVHEPIIDRATWDRVQTLLGQKIYRAHQLTYGSELIVCGHCGSPITGEAKTKKTKKGDRQYIYYRCAHYQLPGHPRIRLTEVELDEQVLALFARMRVGDDEFRYQFAKSLREMAQADLNGSAARDAELVKRRAQVIQQQGRLLNLRLLEEIDADTYASKATELRDEEARLRLEIESCSRNREEIADLAVKTFELSQSLQAQWVTSDYAAKRRILEIVCLNWRLVDGSLCPTMRKPFDLLAEGLVLNNSRGDWI